MDGDGGDGMGPMDLGGGTGMGSVDADTMDEDSTDPGTSVLRSMGYKVDGDAGTKRTDSDSTGSGASVLESASIGDVVLLLGVLVALILFLILMLG